MPAKDTPFCFISLHRYLCREKNKIDEQLIKESLILFFKDNCFFLTFTASYTDKELLSEVANGNELAFGQLYNHWQPQLSSFIFRISKSKVLTAEIVQDVFLKIWISRETLAEIDNFRSYLFVISRNQAINVLRKKMRELRQLETWEKNISKQEETGDDKLIQQTLIDEAIEQLSPRQKEVYLLHRYEKLTYQQIGQRLGIGKESVKTHLELAVKSIKKFLLDRLALTTMLLKIFSNIL